MLLLTNIATNFLSARVRFVGSSVQLSLYVLNLKKWNDHIYEGLDI